VNDDQILNYIIGKATVEEMAELHHWVQSKTENRDRFAELYNSYALLSSKLAPDNHLADYGKLFSIVEPPSQKSIFIFIRKYYSAAASLLFPLLVLAGIWWYYNAGFISEPETFSVVYAPPKHNTQVTLPDGTQVWLSPESKLTYGQSFGKKNRNVSLEGEGYFDVVKNSEKPFTISTSQLNLKVLGTSFNVDAYANEPFVRTTLVCGSLMIEHAQSGESVTMVPGDRVSLAIQNNQFTTEKVNTEIYRLVKSGMIIFKRNTLSEVCRKLERWFMIPVEFSGNEGDLLFTAKFEDESIEQILRILNETIPIQFQVLKDKIIITAN
jgi:ferric-dicitrate binding protein FerR (iron transport regulator)